MKSICPSGIALEPSRVALGEELLALLQLLLEISNDR
jgi:hypothetical protein